jgi:hypothetical protein
MSLLFYIASAIGIFTYREFGRRQGLRESEDATRRAYVDSQLALARESELGHRERSASFNRGVKIAVGAASLLATLMVAYATLAATHAI